MTDDRFPSRPAESNPDPRDVLNAVLDGDATPQSAEMAALAAGARLVRATPLHVEEDASAARLAAIWTGILEDVRPKPVPTSSPAVAFQAMPAPVPKQFVPTGRAGRSGLRAIGTWVSMAAVIAVLIGMGSMAWALRPGGGGTTLLASATSLAVGTAYASPSPVATDAGIRWPVLKDCAAAPRSHEAFAVITREQPEMSGCTSTVAGVALPTLDVSATRPLPWTIPAETTTTTTTATPVASPARGGTATPSA